MKKIGLTSSGSVIVEMSEAHFEALAKLQMTIDPLPQSQRAVLSPSERVQYVRERIEKLKPKRREGVVSSMRAMFQFNGGITEQQIDHTIFALQKEKFLQIDANGKVSYL